MIKTKKSGLCIGLSKMITFPPMGLMSIAESIKESLPGISLDLGRNTLGSQCVDSIVNMIKSAPSKASINLRQNKFDSATLEKIAEAICQAADGFSINSQF